MLNVKDDHVDDTDEEEWEAERKDFFSSAVP